VVETAGKSDSEPRSERPGLLGGLASKLHDGLRATIDALGNSHAQRLAAIVESSDDAIMSIDLDGNIATWNRGAEQLIGYKAEEAIGKPVTTLIPTDREGEEAEILGRIRRGERIDHYKTVRQRSDGTLIQVSLTISPIKDGAGTIIGASKIARDITGHERALKSLAERMQEQAALYEFTDRLFRAACANDVYDAALEAIIRALGCNRASILLFDDAGIMKFVAWRGLSDDYRRRVEGHSPWTRDTVDPQPIIIGDIDAAELELPLKAAVKAEGIGALAFIPLVVKGALVGKFMTYYATSRAFSEADMDLAVTFARQLGFSLERMRAEDHRQRAERARELLLNESRHRIKNTLATVQAIAGQTLRDIPGSYQQIFLARLHALGDAHELLTSGDWTQAPLHDVVKRALKPFEPSQRNRFTHEGPDVWIPAQASLSLTMCLHELATNAAKYGALSNGTGQVCVNWQLLEPHKVKLTWREVGGPTVALPARTGFGTRLIETSFGRDDGACIEFRPEGLVCTMELLL
jgi:PAS domain S-box-containing protein